MTGPEHLRRLDHEYAQGGLPPDEYQVRRAHLLSQLPPDPNPLATMTHTVPPWHHVAPPEVNGHQPIRPPAAATPEWVIQGPDAPHALWRARYGRQIAYVLVGVLLVVSICVAIFRDDEAGSPTGNTTAGLPAPIEQRPPGLPVLPEPPAPKPDTKQNAAVLVDPPGQPRGGGGPFDLAALETGKLLPDAVVQRLKQGKMIDGLFKTTTDGPITYSLLVLHLPDPQSATFAAREYGYTQQEGGLTASGTMALHGVPVFSGPTPSGDGATYRGVYTVYSRVVVVDVAGPEPKATSDFKALLDAQVRNAPPTDRTVN